MKKGYISLVLIVVFAMFIAGCGAAGTGGTDGASEESDFSPAAYDYTKDLMYIGRDDMVLDDIELGISEQALDKRVTGELLSETTSDLFEPSYLTKTRTYSDGLTAVFADFHDDVGPILLLLRTTSEEHETSRGLNVGDSEEKMRELYGNDALKINDTYYFYTKSGDHFQFAVTTKDGIVIEKELSLLMGASICGCVGEDDGVNPAYFMFNDVEHDR
jgi:hypothetical protein